MLDKSIECRQISIFIIQLDETHRRESRWLATENFNSFGANKPKCSHSVQSHSHQPNSGSPDLRPAPVRAASGRTLSSQGRTANIAACVRLKRTVVGRLLSIKFNVELLVKAVKMSSTSSCWRLGRRLDCLPPVRRAARRTRCPRCGHCFCPSAQWRSSRFTATLQL